MAATAAAACVLFVCICLQLDEFPLLRPLVLLNKLLLRHLDLHEPFKGGVGSYLLFTMVSLKRV